MTDAVTYKRPAKYATRGLPKGLERGVFVTPVKKPDLRIPDTKSTLDGLRSKLWSMKGTLDKELDLIKEYLYHIGTTLIVNSERPLRAGSVDLVAENEAMSPFSWVNIVRTTSEGAVSYNTGSFDKRYDIPLLIILFAPVRMSGVANVAYQSKLRNKITERLNSALPKDIMCDLPPNIQTVSWVDDPVYMRLVACFDMFWSMNPEHESSRVRICTLSARDRDLGLFLSVNGLLGQMVMSIDEFAEWMWTSKLTSQYEAVFDDPLEEYKHTQAYIHYAKAFGMCERSPISISMCPDLHFLVHLVGIAMGSPRSTNARLPRSVSTADNILVAAFLAKASNKIVVEGPQYVMVGHEANMESAKEIEAMTQGADDTKSSDLPSNHDGTAWWPVHQEGESRREEIKRIFYKSIDGMTPARPDSILEHLQKTRGAWL